MTQVSVLSVFAPVSSSCPLFYSSLPKGTAADDRNTSISGQPITIPFDTPCITAFRTNADVYRMETKPINIHAIAGKLLAEIFKDNAKSGKPLWMKYHFVFLADLNTGNTVIKVLDPRGKLIGIINQFPDLPC